MVKSGKAQKMALTPTKIMSIARNGDPFGPPVRMILQRRNMLTWYQVGVWPPSLPLCPLSYLPSKRPRVLAN